MGQRNPTYQVTRWHDARHTWREVRTILRLFNRQAELRRLVRWATRKQLAGPRRCYVSHLEDVDQRLFRYRVSSPAVVRWARWAFRLKCLLYRPPRYPGRGAAAGYARHGRLQTLQDYRIIDQRNGPMAHLGRRWPYHALVCQPRTVQKGGYA